MFWIKATVRDDNGNMTTLEKALDVNPSEVTYPERRDFKEMVTQDGATVIQRPLRDTRSRTWIWRGHTDSMALYAAQWALLLSLETRGRLRANLPPTVEIFEDVSGSGGFDRTNGDGSRRYTTVKFVQVDRVPRSGGPVCFDSTVTFDVADASYTAF